MRKPLELVSAERAAEIWRYEPETGLLFLRESGAQVGGGNGTRSTYRQVSYRGHYIKVHRLAWAIAHGRWPSGVVDHINGNRSDNRLANLRDVSQAENQLNQAYHRAGVSKASWDAQYARPDRDARITPRDAKQPARDGVCNRDARARIRLCHCVTGDASRDATQEDRDATPPGIASRSEARCVVEEEKQAGAKAPENKHAARTAAHRAKLSTDPRFAGWMGLMAGDDPAPDQAAIRRREERDELTRRACLSALERAKGVDPALLDQTYLAWARDFVATHPPLGRALGTGE